jgi:hypothetical protein
MMLIDTGHEVPLFQLPVSNQLYVKGGSIKSNATLDVGSRSAQCRSGMSHPGVKDPNAQQLLAWVAGFHESGDRAVSHQKTVWNAVRQFGGLGTQPGQQPEQHSAGLALSQVLSDGR